MDQDNAYKVTRQYTQILQQLDAAHQVPGNKRKVLPASNIHAEQSQID